MKIQSKFNLFIIITIFFTIVTMVFLGTLIISEMSYDLNRRLLDRELSNILSEVEETYHILKKRGALGTEAYVRNAQNEIVNGLKQRLPGKTGHLYIFTADGALLSFPSTDHVPQIPKLAEIIPKERGETDYVLNGQERFCIYDTFPQWNWLVAVSITKEEMYKKRSQYLWYASLIGLLVLSLIFFAGYRMSHNPVSRIDAVLSCVKNVEAGDLTARIPGLISSDEIGTLQRGINLMASTIEARTREQQEAEKALRDSEEQYRILFETTGTATFISEKDMTINLANSELRKILERPGERLEGRSWTEFIPKDDLERLEGYHNIRRVDPNYAPRNYELKVIDVHGNIRDFLITVAMIPGTEKSIASLAEITKLKLTERALRESERRYRFLFNNINDLVTVMRLTGKGLPGKYIEANDIACKNLGYTKEEFAKLSILDVVDSKERDKDSMKWEKLLTDKHVLFETTLVTKNGIKIPAEVNAHLVDFEDHPSIFTCTRDITIRKKSEKELQSERDKFQGVLNAIGEGLYIVNRNFIIEYQNKILIESFGNMEGKKCYNAFFQLNEPCEFCNMHEVLKSGETLGVETVITEGKSFDIFFSPYTDLDGNIKAVVFMRDVTENRRLKAEALRVSHLASLGELAAGVAHEINNPINGIISYAEILVDQCLEGDEDAEIPNRIIKEGDRIAQIVKNLLSFARDRKEEHSPAHIQDILYDTLSLVERQISKDKIKLNVDFPHDLPKIKLRSQEVQQVFLNIISNARYALNRKFPKTHEDKVIEIKVETIEIESQKHVRTIFHDRGTGISGSILDKISDPFFSTKPKGKGIGLGLSISHGIIENHGGRLWFESIEGDYTKVFVDLPVDNGWEFPMQSRIETK